MKKFFLLAVFALLPGCTLSSFADAPPQLFELKASTATQPGPVLATQLLIDAPQASAGIDTSRIAVIQPDGGIAYYKNISWTDAATGMLQTVMLASFEGDGRLPAVARLNTALRADYVMRSDLRQFAYDEKNRTVHIELQMRLIAMPARNIVASKGFTVAEVAESDEISAIIAAFQRASNRLMPELVSWTVASLPPQKVTSQR